MSSIMAQLHHHPHCMSYIDAISEVDRAFPTDPHLFELHDDDLAARRAVASDVLYWVSQHLAIGDCHYLAPEFPGLGERHEFFFEDVIDGELFRKAWGYLDWGRPHPREIPSQQRRGRGGGFGRF